MAVIINEQQAVEQNIFLHEQRLKKPTVRMLDSTPTFVTYYSIDNGETTADDGYKDVHAYIGSRSPIRFNKINNFPIYNIDQIVLQLQDNDQGLDSSYEGEATIVAGTIKPNHNDYFKIPTLHGYFLFRVTDFAYVNCLLSFIEVYKQHRQEEEELRKSVSEEANNEQSKVDQIDQSRINE